MPTRHRWCLTWWAPASKVLKTNQISQELLKTAIIILLMHFHKNICKRNLTRNNILKQLNLISKKRICLRFSNYWNSKSKRIKSHLPQPLKMLIKCRPWRRFRASQETETTCQKVKISTKMLGKAKISSTNSRIRNRIIFRINNSININFKVRRLNRRNSKVFTALPLCRFIQTKLITYSNSSSISPNSYLSNSKARLIRPSTPKTTLKCLKWTINFNNNMV